MSKMEEEAWKSLTSDAPQTDGQPLLRAMGSFSTRVTEMVQIMAEQVEVLQRIDRRQAAADLSRKAMPQVPATSSSAWNPLLSSFLTETIQPKVERWRSGLDTLLVFLGLFSAIVTAFLVDSLSDLGQDQITRTNELLTNLTEIIIALSNNPEHSPNFSLPIEFRPDASSVRVNSFYSLSLIFSLSIAALVVAGRGFVNMIPWSRHKKATLRLSDIHKRWDTAERILRPAIESLPQLLVLPVLLFLAGILDMLISTVLQLPHRALFIVATTGFCLILIAGLCCILLATLIDGSLHPSTSIFQSTLASIIHSTVITRTQSAWSKLGPAMCKKNHVVSAGDSLRMTSDTVYSYHSIVQVTHDDNTLEQAASALLDILRVPDLGTRRRSMTYNELKTLIHFLSPEASFRSNRTAAEVLAETFGDEPFSVGDAHIFDTAGELLAPLLEAMERYHRSAQGMHYESLWDSPFTRAIATVVGYHSNSPCHPVISILTAKSLSWEFRRNAPKYDPVAKRILDLMLTVLSVKLHGLYSLDALEIPARARQARIGTLLCGESGLIYFDLRIFLESLVMISRHHQDLGDLRWIPDFVAWTTTWATLESLISDSLRTLQGDMLNQPWVTWTMKRNLFTYVELVINACIETPEPPAEEGLLNLCILCTSNALRCIETLRSRPPFIDHFLRTLTLSRWALSTSHIPRSTMERHYRPRLLRMLSEIIKIKVWMDQTRYFDRNPDIDGLFQIIMDYVAGEHGEALSISENLTTTFNPSSEVSLLGPLKDLTGRWIDGDAIEPRTNSRLSNRTTLGV
ncbi:hypothetical protein DFH09DRAFT_1134187 [Mycena vulgaris]|nr:hypothetical protein DFH09DRAFT_1134187 [Mycena vulgaris]